MDGFLRQTAALQVRPIGPFLDDTDFKTTETALTIANTDIKLTKNGGTSVNKNSGGGTHRVNGRYSVTWDATDTDTVGQLGYSVVVSGALIVFGHYTVLTAAVYDASFASTAAGYAAGISDIQSRLPAALGRGGMAPDGVATSRNTTPADPVEALIPNLDVPVSSVSGGGAGPDVVGFGDVGDFDAGDLVDVKFVTKVGSVLTALAGSPSVVLYRDNSTTEITTGITLSASFDSVTGLNHVRVDTTALTAGSSYQLSIGGGTVGGTSVVGRLLGSFSVQNRAGLRPTVPKRTLDVSVDGQAGLDWGNIGTPAATVNLANTTMKTSTDLGAAIADLSDRIPVTLIDGRIDANLSLVAAQAVWDQPKALLGTDGSIGELVAANGAAFASMIEPDGAARRYTADALAQAPTGTGGGDVGTAVLNAVVEGTHTVRDSLRLANAANAGNGIPSGGPPPALGRIRTA